MPGAGSVLSPGNVEALHTGDSSGVSAAGEVGLTVESSRARWTAEETLHRRAFSEWRGAGVLPEIVSPVLAKPDCQADEGEVREPWVSHATTRSTFF